jgi:hypothetical protein
VDFKLTVITNKTQLPEPVHEEKTRERVVPTSCIVANSTGRFSSSNQYTWGSISAFRLAKVDRNGPIWSRKVRICFM